MLNLMLGLMPSVHKRQMRIEIGEVIASCDVLAMAATSSPLDNSVVTIK
jgi:hypothetical protein